MVKLCFKNIVFHHEKQTPSQKMYRQGHEVAKKGCVLFEPKKKYFFACSDRTLAHLGVSLLCDILVIETEICIEYVLLNAEMVPRGDVYSTERWVRMKKTRLRARVFVGLISNRVALRGVALRCAVATRSPKISQKCKTKNEGNDCNPKIKLNSLWNAFEQI
jgi:hypothetical protein